MENEAAPSRAPANPLHFLRRVRDVMITREPVQARLDNLMRVIASEFKSEVCSLYLLRAGDVLELFASVGLNASAVHNTRLQVGEGLVGEIARSAEVLNMPFAEKHSKFVYRPETGEEKYHGFVGVPILRGDHSLGVLVVQSRKAHDYSNDQVELLQTVAMVLAEIIESGEIVDQSEVKKGAGQGILSLHLSGTRLAGGIAHYPAILHRTRVEIENYVSETPSLEKERLQEAIDALQRSIEDAIANSDFRGGEEQREIFEAYRLFAQDKGWINRILQAIDLGLTAEAAVQRVQEQLHARMNQLSSEYLRERVRDLEDLSNRLILHLSGVTGTSTHELPDEFILVAEDIGPVELLDYGRKHVKGLVLEEGSSTSHIIIIARAMDIPVVGKIKHAMDLIREGDPIIVDGDNGELYIRPTHDIEQMIGDQVAHSQERAAYFDTLKEQPSETADGTRISLNINAGLFVDVKRVQEKDVDGIGLYRTELPYMLAQNFPDVDAQYKTYSKILRQTQGKRVIFRTFDVGGDKPLPYFKIDEEENPAMGWRATRIGLDRPAILMRQCRALIMAASERRLDVMFPFISEVTEFDRAKVLFDREVKRVAAMGFAPPSEIRLGIMVEIPSIIWQIPQLKGKVDFVSVGSNDLLQFLFACDRGNPHLADRYDTLSPTALRVFRDIASQCRENGINMGFCGEMARRPLEAMALIGIGIRSLSLSAGGLGAVKAMVRSVNLPELSEYMDYVCSLPVRSARELLYHYARDHGIEV